MAPFPQAQAEAAVERAFGRPLQRDIRKLRPGGGRRFDRAGPPRRSGDRGRRAAGGGQDPATGHRTPLQGRSGRLFLCRPQCRAIFHRGATAAAGRDRGDACAVRSRSKWICGSKPPRSRKWPRTPRTIRIFGCLAVDWERTARDVLTLEWIEGTPLADHAAARSQGFRPETARARRDPELPASCIARRLFSRRHASGKSVRRRRRPDRRGRFRDHGAARRQGAPLPRRNPVRLHHAQLSPHGGSSFRGRLRSPASLGREFRAGDPRHRRADPQPDGGRNLDGKALDAAVRGHRTV